MDFAQYHEQQNERRHRDDMEVRRLSAEQSRLTMDLQHRHVEALAKLRAENAKELNELTRSEAYRYLARQDYVWAIGKSAALVLATGTMFALGLSFAVWLAGGV